MFLVLFEFFFIRYGIYGQIYGLIDLFIYFYIYICKYYLFSIIFDMLGIVLRIEKKNYNIYLLFVYSLVDI